MKEANRVSRVVASTHLSVLQIFLGWFWQVARDFSASNERPEVAAGEQRRVMAIRCVADKRK
jgi:hypothetical protein